MRSTQLSGEDYSWRHGRCLQQIVCGRYTDLKQDFHKFLDNKWTILFSHPADFTPVCTTELGAFAKLKDEFDARGVQMIGLVRLIVPLVA